MNEENRIKVRDIPRYNDSDFEEAYRQIKQEEDEKEQKETASAFDKRRHPLLTREHLKEWVDDGMPDVYEEARVKEKSVASDYDICVERNHRGDRTLVSIKTYFAYRNYSQEYRSVLLRRIVPSNDFDSVWKTVEELSSYYIQEKEQLARLGYSYLKRGRYRKTYRLNGQTIADVRLIHDWSGIDNTVLIDVDSYRRKTIKSDGKRKSIHTDSMLEAVAVFETQFDTTPMVDREMTAEQSENLIMNSREDLDISNFDIEEWANSLIQ